jgi:hypothetical protein
MIAAARAIPIAPIAALASCVLALVPGHDTPDACADAASPSADAPSSGPCRTAIAAAIEAAGEASEAFRAAFGGGMTHMTPADRAIYERLCAVHTELRRRRGAVAPPIEDH